MDILTGVLTLALEMIGIGIFILDGVHLTLTTMDIIPTMVMDIMDHTGIITIITTIITMIIHIMAIVDQTTTKLVLLLMLQQPEELTPTLLQQLQPEDHLRELQKQAHRLQQEEHQLQLLMM